MRRIDPIKDLEYDLLENNTAVYDRRKSSCRDQAEVRTAHPLKSLNRLRTSPKVTESYRVLSFEVVAQTLMG